MLHRFAALCCLLLAVPVWAADTDKDGVPGPVDPAPNNILITGYQPPWLYTFNGDSRGGYFGDSVSGAGDVNNDGYDDVIVGANRDDNNNLDSDSGSARVLSGANGAILYTFKGDNYQDLFGGSVSGAGDVNNDGYADVIVGATGGDNNGKANSGSAQVLSGKTGAILYTFNGDSADDRFGVSVSDAGDVNNDGYADVIVGADQDDNNGADSGSARVLSGANGAILYTFNGDSASDYFGRSVSGAGDVNNDGYADVIVGASGDDNNGSASGSARVFSGANGAILYTFNGDSASDSFGGSVSGAGDVNNDGYADVIVGASADDNNGKTDSGSARVFSGANGAILYTFNGDSAYDEFGISVSGAGDVNNDGYDDVIVGAHWDDNKGSASGSARVFSGTNGAILYTFNGDSAADYFGGSVSGAGDVNNDGYADVIVGAWLDDNKGGLTLGSARVFSGALFLQQSTDTDGDGLVNTLETDDDNDGMSDAWELQYGLNPLVDEGQAAADPDGDGLSNGEESQLGSSPFSTESDQDGVPDAIDPAPNNSGVTGYQPPWLYTFNGDSASENFGYSVSGAGDVNNDGVDDVIVGARADDNNGTDSGSARVLSGANGAILYTLNGDSAGDRFGVSVSGAGDVNNDGYADVIVGAHADDNNGTDSGSARVLSGANSAILYTFNGDSAHDYFGFSVSGAGDVNNDGYADVIVGAYGDDNNGGASGSARVLSGANGAILYTFNGDSANDNFGDSVSGAGDVNNDGYADVIVGAYYDDNNGRTDSGSARVLSGKTGAILYTFNGDSAYDEFGISVSGAGDVNKDGYADVIVGAYQDDNNGTDSGSARVLSGANGAILYTFNGDTAGDLFGTSLSGAGDVNNDGYADVIVGAYVDDNNGDSSGSARVFSGANGAILYTFNGDSAVDYFGSCVSGTGDVNNDGYADVIVGAWADDNNGTSSGSARVFSGAMFLQQGTDTDDDGQVDTLDTDDDADGVSDVSDAFPQDTDNDGLSNADDTDDDNDGVPDYIDAEPLNAGNANGRTLLLNAPYKGSSVREAATVQ